MTANVASARCAVWRTLRSAAARALAECVFHTLVGFRLYFRTCALAALVGGLSLWLRVGLRCASLFLVVIFLLDGLHLHRRRLLGGDILWWQRSHFTRVLKFVAFRLVASLRAFGVFWLVVVVVVAFSRVGSVTEFCEHISASVLHHGDVGLLLWYFDARKHVPNHKQQHPQRDDGGDDSGYYFIFSFVH